MASGARYWEPFSLFCNNCMPVCRTTEILYHGCEGEGKKRELGAEDIAPYLNFVLIRACPVRIFTDIEFVKLFMKNNEELPCDLVHVYKMCEYILDSTHETYNVSENEYIKKCNEAIINNKSNNAKRFNEIIERCIDDVERYRASVVGMPSKDTVKIVDAGGFVVDTPNRALVWNIQTPQCFEIAKNGKIVSFSSACGEHKIVLSCICCIQAQRPDCFHLLLGFHSGPVQRRRIVPHAAHAFFHALNHCFRGLSGGTVVQIYLHAQFSCQAPKGRYCLM